MDQNAVGMLCANHVLVTEYDFWRKHNKPVDIVLQFDIQGIVTVSQYGEPCEMSEEITRWDFDIEGYGTFVFIKIVQDSIEPVVVLAPIDFDL